MNAPDIKKTRAVLVLAALLAAVLGFLFQQSIARGQALFANDGPLGAQVSQIFRLPGAFTSIWSDLYWVGTYGGNYSANVTGTLLWLFGPIAFNKFYVPCTLLFLGLSAAYFFQRLRFSTSVCVLGGLAAALNMNFFSNAAWGLGTRPLCLGFTFLALAALHEGGRSKSLFRNVMLTILAGLAVGMSISEGGDNGAIFSLFVAAFALFDNLMPLGPLTNRLTKGVARVVVMAVFAAVLAAQTLNIFVSTAVKGIVGVQQDAATKGQKWDWATQWSLPKIETLRVISPGLFGYRLDTDKGGNYWGTVGQQPGWGAHHQGFARHSGSGEYAGVLVVLIAVWSVAQSFRKNGNAFAVSERQRIWFWTGAALLALLFAWGRHAPFYQFLYALPYFSTIRNPMKFMHPFHMCVMILFGYGLQGIWRLSLEKPLAQTGSLFAQLQTWWANRNPFEKRWTSGMIAAVVLSAVAFLAYSASQQSLADHLMKVGFADAALSKQMAKFSVNEAGLSVVFLACTAAVLLLIQSGAFAGRRSIWAATLLGLILVADLCRANAPWIVYYNYQQRYATNPVLDVLRNKSYEQRIAMLPPELFVAMYGDPGPSGPVQQAFRVFSLYKQIYDVEWMQHHFPYYDIQSLDVPQEPRMPADKAAYRAALATNPLRLWELTNTRYLCGLPGPFVDDLNTKFDPAKRRFREVMRFDFFQAGDNVIGVKTNGPGNFALIEFTGALPRVKLYPQWQVITNNEATLAKLADPNFDPARLVLVADEIPPASTNTANAAAAMVKAEIASYAPKKLAIRTSADVPTVLLVNSKYDGNWNVSIDGQPAPLRRCNFLMQGVALPAGDHTVRLQYNPPATIFFVSLGAVLLGIVLCGLLFVAREKAEDDTAKPAPGAKKQTQ